MSPAEYVLAAVVTISAAGWILLFRRKLRGADPLPFEHREPITWTGGEALLVICAYIICGSTAGSFAKTQQAADAAREATHAVAMGAGWAAATIAPQASPLLRLLQGKFLADLLFLVIGAVIFRFARRVPPEQLGLAMRPWYDLRVGLAAFVLIVPPVILIQNVLVEFLGQSVHPVLVGLKSSKDGGLWLWSALLVVGTAPLVEEFLFRSVIQNWLTRAWSFAAEPRVDPEGKIILPKPWAAALAHDGPIVATAGFFALVHLGNGPDPIPLFFFALGLGYLFRQTNRIWPGWLVHVLLNGFSLSVLPLDF